jgi:hypothetical protein
MAAPTEGKTILTKKPTTTPLEWRLLVLALLSLAACVTNKSSDPRLSSVVHQCFRTTDDAILFQTSSCPPLNGMSAISTCVTVKYLSSFSPPITLREYNTNSSGAAWRVSDELAARSTVFRGVLRPREHASLLGILKSGTPFMSNICVALAIPNKDRSGLRRLELMRENLPGNPLRYLGITYR